MTGAVGAVPADEEGRKEGPSMKLVSDAPAYQMVWEEEDKPKEQWPVFHLRLLSAGQVNAIDDQVTRTEKKGARIHFLGGTSRRLKINAAVIDWENVQEEDGSEAKCTAANKEKLSADIQAWLEDDINKRNGLQGLEENERKNS